MPRKPASRTRTHAPAKQSPAAVPSSLHMPRMQRIVTAHKRRASEADGSRRAGGDVLEIRLSGDWLNYVGFPKGRRYLISVDAPFETIYLQAMPLPPKPRRRR